MSSLTTCMLESLFCEMCCALASVILLVTDYSDTAQRFGRYTHELKIISFLVLLSASMRARGTLPTFTFKIKDDLQDLSARRVSMVYLTKSQLPCNEYGRRLQCSQQMTSLGQCLCLCTSMNDPTTNIFSFTDIMRKQQGYDRVVHIYMVHPVHIIQNQCINRGKLYLSSAS